MKAFLFLLLFSICPQSQCSQNAMKVSVEKDIKLAKPFKLIFQDASGKEIISVSTASFKSADFDILRIVKKAPDTVEMEAMPFAIGIATFPAVEFSDTEGKRFTPELPVKILPRFEKTDGKLRDIYPPFFFINIWKILFWLAVLAVLYAAFKKFSSRMPAVLSAAAAEDIDARTPYEKAMERIAVIEREAAVNFSAADFYDALSSAFRTYVAQRYMIGAPKMTTAEFLKAFKNEISDYSLLAGIRETLDIADLAKFAKFSHSLSCAMENSDRTKKLITRLEELKISREEKLKEQKSEGGKNAV